MSARFNAKGDRSRPVPSKQSTSRFPDPCSAMFVNCMAVVSRIGDSRCWNNEERLMSVDGLVGFSTRNPVPVHSSCRWGSCTSVPFAR